MWLQYNSLAIDYFLAKDTEPWPLITFILAISQGCVDSEQPWGMSNVSLWDKEQTGFLKLSVSDVDP